MGATDFPYASAVLGLLIVALLALAIIVTKSWHGKHSLDATHGVQRNHEDPTPRVGGVAIFIGLVVALWAAPPPVQTLLGPMLIASLPAFLFGLAEDLTKKISVRERLFATLSSGLLAWFITGVSIDRVDLPMIDGLLTMLPLSVLFTAIAISGLANSVNLIDGFNGIASGSFLISLGALGVLAQMHGDTAVAYLCIVLAASAIGFFLFNFPIGKIFLGDGGAYLLGFFLGWVAVLLSARNREMSAWAALLACGYPVLETVISVARRMLSRQGLGSPDRLHLHSLIGERLRQQQTLRWSASKFHATIATLIWLFALLPAAFALAFPHSTPALIAGFFFSAGVYLSIYLFIARTAGQGSVDEAGEQVLS